MTALTDALAEADKWFERGIALMVDDRHPFVAAARRVAQAPQVWWCETHQAPEDPSEPPPWCLRARLAWDTYQNASLADGCRMVRKLLVDPPKENT